MVAKMLMSAQKMLIKKVAQHLLSGNTLENVPKGLYNAFLKKIPSSIDVRVHQNLLSSHPDYYMVTKK